MTLVRPGGPVLKAPMARIAEGRAATSTTFYNIPGNSVGAQTVFTIIVNTLYHFPMHVATQITLDQLALEVTTGVASTNIRMGIYDANASWQPVNLVVDAGTVATATTGVKTVAVTNALSPGRYLLVFVSDGGPALRIISLGVNGAPLLDTLGASPAQTRWNRAFTYAALPATGTDWDTAASADTSGAGHAMMFVRILTP